MENINKNFDEKILNGICIVDFWAEWCGPPEFATFIFKKIHKGLFFKSFSIAFFQFCVIIIVGR